MTLEADFLTSEQPTHWLKIWTDRDLSNRAAACPPSGHATRKTRMWFGNLLLHLEGNVRQKRILSGIQAGPDGRDRPGVVPARTGANASVLFAKLRGTVVKPPLLSALCHTGGSPKRSPFKATKPPCPRPSSTSLNIFRGTPTRINLLTKRFTKRRTSVFTVTWTRRAGEKPSKRPATFLRYGRSPLPRRVVASELLVVRLAVVASNPEGHLGQLELDDVTRFDGRPRLQKNAQMCCIKAFRPTGPLGEHAAAGEWADTST